MNSRGLSFVALLAVIGLSIVFGMVVGGRVNAPRVAMALPASAEAADGTIQLAPAATGTGFPNFADIVEEALPAVVGVSNTQSASEEGDSGLGDEFFRWFFGDPENRERQRFHGNPDRPRIGFGSGFIISQDGYILTNNHVVQDSDRISVSMQDGRRLEARLIGADPAIDLALIKVDADEPLPVLSLGDSDALRVGEWVIAIGNPLDFDQTVTVGVVSAKYRQVPLENTDISLAQFIQTDAAINFGNSGGPLLDAAGNVIGINTAIRRGNLAEGIGFALPINEARAAMKQLLATGSVQRGFLGITLTGDGISDTAADYYGLPDTNGAIVQGVTEDEPADRAGIEKGDIIRKVNGKVVRNNRDLIRRISSYRPGDKVELEIFRDGKSLTKTALLIDRNEGQLTGNRGQPPVRPSEPEEPTEAKGLGVTVQGLTPSMRTRLGMEDDLRGVLVVDVEIDSPLADANVVPNTLILSINDRSIGSVSAWNDVVDSLQPGEAIKVEIMDPRAGASRYVFLRVPKG